MKYSGQLGYVLLPDVLTDRTARDMSHDVSGNRITFKGANVPHMTLYHAKLNNVAELQVKNFLFWMKDKLPMLVRYAHVEPFGGKFSFWMLEKSPELLHLHNAALFVLSAHYDASGPQQADSEQLELTPDEKENVRIHGHPNVGNLWKPHITLGYTESASYAFPAPMSGLFVKGAFVEIGAFGMITRIIHQTH